MDYSQRAAVIEGPPYWLLARLGDAARDGSGSGERFRDVLTLEAETGRVLPLFGSEASAASFLGSFSPEARRRDWRATRAGARELLTLLSTGESSHEPRSPCSEVEEVTFDPPEPLAESADPDVPTVGRRVFMDQLLGRGGRWSGSR